MAGAREKKPSRRSFLGACMALGATPVWAFRSAARSRLPHKERPDLYPQGVASGDPDSTSVLLWTRRPFSAGLSAELRLEVSEDQDFHRVVARARPAVLAAADWTCRALVGNLKSDRIYWYRFIDKDGNSSRIGRTRTAPRGDSEKTVKFAFACCQNINLGAQQAYRRMIFDDARAAEDEQLQFVLHLGDFIYAVVGYPEDKADGMWGRKILDTVRLPDGETLDYGEVTGTVHIPVSLEDYRTLYRKYLEDPDLQAARARWPFVCIWDNCEFYDSGWQGMHTVNGENRPAQTAKVAANQAWFEYQPARIARPGGLAQFHPPRVHDAPVERFDEYGFGDEPNNRAAVESLTGYRVLHRGRHLDLVLTDQHSYRSENPMRRKEAQGLAMADFLSLVPSETLEALDAGRAYEGGNPPATLAAETGAIANFWKDRPPQTILGAEQKSWLLDQLAGSRATWKIWANTEGSLEWRADPQHLPEGLVPPWPGKGYGCLYSRDHASAFLERAEIYRHVREKEIAGFAILAGDRHSFWAGSAAASLPPAPFDPIGVAFVTAGISSPTHLEVAQSSLAADHPLRKLYVSRRSPAAPPEMTGNLLLRHGVRAALEYARTGDLEEARKLSNPDLAPHLSFLDLDGNGYSVMRLTGDALTCEFVCIPHPAGRIAAADGGPVLYRVVHRAPLWRAGETPRLEQKVLEGNPILSL